MTYYNRQYGTKALVKITGGDKYYIIEIIKHLEERYEIDPEFSFLSNKGEPGVHVFIHIKGEKEGEV